MPCNQTGTLLSTVHHSALRIWPFHVTASRAAAMSWGSICFSLPTEVEVWLILTIFKRSWNGSCVCCCLSSFLQKSMSSCCIHRGVQKWCQKLCPILVWVSSLNKRAQYLQHTTHETQVTSLCALPWNVWRSVPVTVRDNLSTRVKPGILTKWNGFSFSGTHLFKGPVYKIQLCFKICVTEIMNNIATVYRYKFSRFVVFCGNEAHARTHACTHTRVRTHTHTHIHRHSLCKLHPTFSYSCLHPKSNFVQCFLIYNAYFACLHNVTVPSFSSDMVIHVSPPKLSLHTSINFHETWCEHRQNHQPSNMYVILTSI